MFWTQYNNRWTQFNGNLSQLQASPIKYPEIVGNAFEPEPYTKLKLIFNIWGGCTCKDLIDANGAGNCQDTISSTSGKAGCYVNQPSTCGDLKDSSTNPGEKFSTEACLISGKLMKW